MSMACWPAADFTGQNVPVWFNGTWAWPNEKASATAVHYSTSRDRTCRCGSTERGPG